jgi:hypothetical protein
MQFAINAFIAPNANEYDLCIGTVDWSRMPPGYKEAYLFAAFLANFGQCHLKD